MRKRSPHVEGRTVLGAPFAGRPTAPVARGNLSSRPPLRCVSAALDRLRTFGVTACNRVFHGAHGNVRRPTYAISRAQPAHLWRDAPDRRRPSSGGRGVGDAAPYGGCETCVDAYMVTGIRRYPFTNAGRAWKPAPTVGIRTAPTLHQPLSHGASRRDSSPFRGAERWDEVCGAYASAYRDADICVSHSPVRCTVPDAPRSRDRRAALDASVRLDR